MPAFNASLTSSANAFAVIAMIGIVTASFRGSARIAFVASYPFITGICTSIKITSNSPTALSTNRSSASLPFSATSQFTPSKLSSSIKISALISLSSATRTCSPKKPSASSSSNSGPCSLSLDFNSKSFSFSAVAKNGFERKASIPTLGASPSIASRSLAVRIKIQTPSGAIRRICLTASLPPIPGIFQSISIIW